MSASYMDNAIGFTHKIPIVTVSNVMAIIVCFEWSFVGRCKAKYAG